MLGIKALWQALYFMGLQLYTLGLLTAMGNSTISGGFSGASEGFSRGLVFPFGLFGAFSVAALLSVPLNSCC